MLDHGVKVDTASASDPSEFLSLQDYARYFLTLVAGYKLLVMCGYT